MTVSAPYPDPSNQRRTVDYLVAVRACDRVEIHRFAALEDAQAFSDANQDETPGDEPGVRGCYPR